MMEKKRYLLYTCLVPAMFFSIVVAIDRDDVCSLPPATGVCSSLFMAWYYDPLEEQCREFIYGGCGGNGNRFANEEDCYKRCRERLIDLHPPDKVTVAFTLDDRLFLFWFPPKNFKIHDESDAGPGYNIAVATQKTLTAKGAGVAHIVSKIITTAAPESGETTKAQQTSSQTTGSNTSNADIDTTNQNNTKLSVDKNSTVSENTNTSLGLGSQTNVTEGGANNNSVSVSNNPTGTSSNNTMEEITVKSKVDDTTQNTPVTKVAANSTDDGDKIVVYQLKDFVGKEKVPFHFAILKAYIVSYRKDENAEWTNITMSLDNQEYWLRNLTPNTDYTIRVGALYSTNTIMFVEVKATTQLDANSTGTNCVCNHEGTVGGGRPCNFSLTLHPMCKCKPAFSGLFCELCHSGYYRITDKMPCHKCPCGSISSTRSCHFIEGYLHCLRCKDGYTGRLCQHCDNGYYRDHQHTASVCVKCRGCHNVGQGLICDPGSGRCITCHYNTTGHRCDKCLPGFEGDPLNGIRCTWIETSKAGLQMLSSGVIAVICVVTILVISGVVGYIIYRRMKNYPSNRPFWTIELKEGHEGVNFSSVPDDDIDRYHDDVRLTEKESKSKSQPYSRLQEDM